ncbi:MAG: hypothetical protein Q9170_002980 [Blastenia crenularia]
MASILDQELANYRIDIDYFENKTDPWRPWSMITALTTFGTAPIMGRLRELDDTITSILERELRDDDPGVSFPTTPAGRTNEREWARSFALIEGVMEEMLFFFGVTVDPGRRDDGTHSYHRNLLRDFRITFQRETEIERTQITKALTNIDHLRKWRNWNQYREIREPAKSTDPDGDLWYEIWYTEVMEGLGKAFIICSEESLLRQMYSRSLEDWSTRHERDSSCHICYCVHHFCDNHSFLRFKEAMRVNDGLMEQLLRRPRIVDVADEMAWDE